MSLNIDTLSTCEPDAAADDTIPESAPTANFKHCVALCDDGISSVGLEDYDPTAGLVSDNVTDVPFDMQVDTYAEVTARLILGKRHRCKMQASNDTETCKSFSDACPRGLFSLPIFQQTRRQKL